MSQMSEETLFIIEIKYITYKKVRKKTKRDERGRVIIRKKTGTLDENTQGKHQTKKTAFTYCLICQFNQI